MGLRDSKVAQIGARIRELLPHGLLRGILPTLRLGDVYLGVHDVPTQGAQRLVLQVLAEGFDGQIRSSQSGRGIQDSILPATSLNCTSIYCGGFEATGSCQKMRRYFPTRPVDCRYS